ncbi:hypothetical protein A2U01_0069044, partial [Trifolium medium]|nr:hypothetical protein [Trifolium medium]
MSVGGQRYEKTAGQWALRSDAQLIIQRPTGTPANSDEADTGTHADVEIPPFLNRKRASGSPNPRKWFDTWG